MGLQVPSDRKETSVFRLWGNNLSPVRYVVPKRRDSPGHTRKIILARTPEAF